MDSADVEMPLADEAHATANESSPLSKSVTGTKRTRGDVKTGWRLKSLQLPPLVLKEGAVSAAVAAAPVQVVAV